MELTQIGSMCAREVAEAAMVRGGTVFNAAKQHVGNPMGLVPPLSMDTFQREQNSQTRT